MIFSTPESGHLTSCDPPKPIFSFLSAVFAFLEWNESFSPLYFVPSTKLSVFCSLPLQIVANQNGYIIMGDCV